MEADAAGTPGALSAVVVAYDTPAEVAAVVASLRAQNAPPAEIVVVDNGAADGVPLPDVAGARILRPSSNVGFGGGCNLGAAAASGDLLLFLNADVVLSARATREMLGRVASDPRIGVVGPRVMSGGELQLSARSFPSLRTGLLGRRSRLTQMLIRARRYPAEFRGLRGDGGPVDWVSGAAMLLRREAFEQVGGFDERYWMYWEDADLCRRLRDRGWLVWYERDALVHHATGASGTSERTIRAFHQSAKLFAETHLASSSWQLRAISTVLTLRSEISVRLFRSRYRSSAARAAGVTAASHPRRPSRA